MKKLIVLVVLVATIVTGSALAAEYGWGSAGDTPIPADYDGNGTSDIAVFRQGTMWGEWWIKGHSPELQVWGLASDTPVPADYDGDGFDDIAVFRNGEWYIKDQPPYPIVWGQAGDIPVPDDYDGDGDADIAVWRPSDGRWYIYEPAPDPVIAAVGDICSTPTDCAPSAAVVAAINPDKVLLLGDNAYPNGALSDYTSFYQPNYGQFNDIVRPSPGNHDYQTPSATGYFAYFQGVESYYSFNLGAWHIISLNSEIPVNDGSAQENWLTADLAANAGKCILAYWHKPRWASSAVHASNTAYSAIWQDLYDAGADVVLAGHNHHYERFARMNGTGGAAVNGLRQITVGTGGRGLYAFGTPIANSEVRNNTTFGVLKMTLHPTSYDWQFMPIAGQTFTDSGSANC